MGHKIVLAIIPLILSMGIIPAISFAENERYVLSHFSTKGKITENNPFGGAPMWTLISGDQGTLVTSTSSGIVVIRLDLKPSDSCPEFPDIVCLDSTVTSIKNSFFGFIVVGDQLKMVFAAPDKQKITIQSGELAELVIELDLSKVWIQGIKKIVEKNIEEEEDPLVQEALSKLREATELIEDSQIQKALKDSNEEFATLDDPYALINERDDEWILAEDDELTPFMGTILGNKASEFLRKVINEDKMKPTDFVYEEIILTNTYGANVAQTGKTTDYKQWDEKWWTLARDKGVHFESGFDESAGVQSLDMSVRISDENGRFLGVIKFVINIEKQF